MWPVFYGTYLLFEVLPVLSKKQLNFLPSFQPRSTGCREQSPDLDKWTAVLISGDSRSSLSMTMKGSRRTTTWLANSSFPLSVSSLTITSVASSSTSHLKDIKAHLPRRHIRDFNPASSHHHCTVPPQLTSMLVSSPNTPSRDSRTTPGNSC